MKRAVSILLTLAMIISTVGVFPVQASAEELELDAAIEMPFEENPQNIARITTPSSFVPPAVERDDNILSIQDTAALESGNVYQGSYDSITWTLDTGTGVLNITGTGTILRGWYYQGNFLGSYIKSINIGSGITDIGEEAFIECSNLKSIVLPQTIQSVGKAAFAVCESLTNAVIYGEIGESAFNNCISLQTVQINGSPETIGDTAFAYCSALTSINIPSSVASIGVGAFAYCEALTNAHLSGNMDEAAFACCYCLEDVQIENCASIGKGCFSECGALTSITIPDTVRTIHESAFEKCTSLSQVILPNNLSSLEYHVFAYCDALQTITIPTTVKRIEDGVFGMCEALSTVNVPSGCTYIGESAFYGCKSLTTISLPSNVNEIGPGAFYECEKLESITLPRNLKTLGSHAFTNCSALQSLSFSSGLEQVGEFAFAVCHALNSVTLPDTVQNLGDYAFYDCPALASIRIPNGVTALPEGIFAQCEGLQAVTMSDDVTEIAKGAFYSCSSLSSISIPVNLQDLGWAAFSGCKNLTAVHLPAGVTRILQSTFLNCEKLSSVTMDGNVTSIGDYAFGLCSSLTALLLPDTVTEIGTQAFAYCEKLSTFNYPASLRTIGDAAFFCCAALTSAYIGPGVTAIGDDAFSACSSLRDFTLASENHNFVLDGNALYNADRTRLISVLPLGQSTALAIPDTVTDLGKYAFAQIDGLKTVVLPASVQTIDDLMFINCASLEAIDIPSGVTKIGAYAFAGCTALKRVGIPATVTEISEGAFFNCSSLTELQIPEGVGSIPHGAFYNCVNLKEITLPASLTEIDSYAFSLCRALEADSLPQSVSKIGEYAFAGCGALALTELPASLTELKEGAFAECNSLTSLKIPASVANIDNFVFSNCPSLTSVEMQGYVYAIGVGSFYGDEALTEVIFAGNAPELIGENGFAQTNEELVLHYDQAATGWALPQWTGPDGNTYHTGTVYSGTCGDDVHWRLVTATGDMTVQGSGAMYDWNVPENTPWHEYADMIRSVTVCEGVTSVGTNAFASLAGLISISIPSTVTTVGYGAFANSLNLREVNCEGGLKALSRCLFYGCDQITQIVLAEGLTEIPDYAFYCCANLQEITIPASVKTIGEGAFAACLSLQSVSVKADLDSIGQGAFFNCASLNSIYLQSAAPRNIGADAFKGCATSLSVYGGNDNSWLNGYEGNYQELNTSAFSGTVGSITWKVNPVSKSLVITGEGAIPDFEEETAPWFEYAEYIYSVIINPGITSVGNYALSGLSNANNVELPDSVTGIGNYAVSGCISLNEIQLPAELVTLGEGVFSGCLSLKHANIPSAIDSIPNYTFFECVLLESIEADNIRGIGYGAFNCCLSFKGLDSWENVESVGDWAFTTCTALTSVDLSACEYVGEYAFAVCENLAEVNLSNRLTHVGKKAFTQTAIASVKLPASLTIIAESAFELCSDLSDVHILGNNVVIENDAFYGCESLKSIDFDSVVSIGERAFMASGLTSVEIAPSINEIGNGAFADCINLTVITSLSSHFTCIDNVLYQGEQLLQFPAGLETSSFTVPNIVNSIAEFAFYGCGRLVVINVGNSVQEIGKAAFAYCTGLKRVTLGTGVSAIPTGLFGMCSSLEQLRFFGDAPATIGEDAFSQVNDDLFFEYFSKNSGWTNGEWIGPDGVTYSTAAIGTNSTGFLMTPRVDKTVGKVYVTVDNFTQGEENVCFVAALYKGIKCVSSKSFLTSMQSFNSGVFTISVNDAHVDDGYHLEIFLLDQNTGAPLCGMVSVNGLYSLTETPDDTLIIEYSTAVQVTGSMHVSDAGKQETYDAYLFESDEAPAVPDVHKFAVVANENSIVLEYHTEQNLMMSTGSNTLTTVEMTMEEIDKIPEKLKNGDKINYEEQTDNQDTFNSGINAEYEFYSKDAVIIKEQDRCIVNSYEKPDGTTVRVGRVRSNGNGHFSLGSIDKEGFHAPNAKGQLNYNKSIYETEGPQHDLLQKWNIPGVKLMYKNKTVVSEVYGNVNFQLGDGTIVDGEAKVGYDAYRNENHFSIEVMGKEIVKVEAEAGIGESARAGISVSNKKIKFKAGLKHGGGGGVGVEIDPENLLKVFGEAGNRLYRFLLYNKDKEGKKDLIGAVQFKMENGEITNLYCLPPAITPYMPGDSVYMSALPQSAGGLSMPATVIPNPGGGSISSNVPQNGLTPEQQRAINESIAAQTVAGGIPISVTEQIIQSYITSQSIVDITWNMPHSPVTTDPGKITIIPAIIPTIYSLDVSAILKY